MERIKKYPLVQLHCASEDMLYKLQQNSKILETILLSLSNYLEQVRLIFPRFYILSNDDLLQILSQTRSPIGIQPHLKKVFDNINRIVFVDNITQNQVKAMCSHDPVLMPEVVKFEEIVQISPGEKVRLKI